MYFSLPFAPPPLTSPISIFSGQTDRDASGDGDPGDRTKAAGHGFDGGGGFQRGHPGAGGKEGGEYRNGSGDGRGGRYGAAFHAAKETVESGQTDVGHAAEGTGGVVSD